MELAGIFATAFLVGFSGAMMPCPLLTVTIGESTRRGFVAGPLIVFGHAILEGALVIGLALGLASVITAPVVARAIAVIGGLFLIYMGWGMARDAWTGRVALAVGREQSGARQPLPDSVEVGIPGNQRFCHPGQDGLSGGMHPVLAGILISLSNPYWTLWLATVGLGYIVLSLKQGPAGLASFFSGHILSDLVWYSLVAAAVAGGRRFLKPGIYRGILVACGVFLLFLGGSFIFWGLRT